MPGKLWLILLALNYPRLSPAEGKKCVRKAGVRTPLSFVRALFAGAALEVSQYKRKRVRQPVAPATCASTLAEEVLAGI